MSTSEQPPYPDNGSDHDFEEHRAVLFTLAYGMLGSAAEAEDIVQETWLRRQRVEEPVRHERALLCRIATRLALNTLRSEAGHRQAYPGPWLPEPVATKADLADDLILAETVSQATLMVLETLSPRRTRSIPPGRGLLPVVGGDRSHHRCIRRRRAPAGAPCAHPAARRTSTPTRQPLSRAVDRADQRHSLGRPGGHRTTTGSRRRTRV